MSEERKMVLVGIGFLLGFFVGFGVFALMCFTIPANDYPSYAFDPSDFKCGQVGQIRVVTVSGDQAFWLDLFGGDTLVYAAEGNPASYEVIYTSHAPFTLNGEPAVNYDGSGFIWEASSNWNNKNLRMGKQDFISEAQDSVFAVIRSDETLRVWVHYNISADLANPDFPTE